jgi:hypothetical protein
LNFRAIPERRGAWLVGALLVAGAGELTYHVRCSQGAICDRRRRARRHRKHGRGGGDSAAGTVDVGAQTFGKLQSLKVKRGDQVIKDQLLAEIDPVLADSALTAANATLQNITSQRAQKQAQLALAQAQRDRNDKLFADGLIAASDRDITKANFDVASADVAALSAQI